MLKSCAPSGKNGRFSAKARLERGQVDFRGIGLDLAEVGVHGGVERQVGPEAHLHVGADAARSDSAVVERVARIAVPFTVDAPRHVGQQLDPPRRPDAARSRADRRSATTQTRSVRGTSTQ